MKAARTHGAHSLIASLQAATKPATGQLPGQASFQAELKGAIDLPGGLGQKPGEKAKDLVDGAVGEIKGEGAKAGAAGKKGDAASELAAKGKEKEKSGSKLGSELGATVETKNADSPAAVVDGTAVPVIDVTIAAQQGTPTKNVMSDAGAPAVNSATNSASTSTLQQAPMPVEIAPGPVELAAEKQVSQASALEGKAKRVIGPGIAGSGEKTGTNPGSVDGLASNTGAAGITMGGVGGQAMQGGHSSGSSGHNEQPAPSHPVAGAGPQMMASSPSQLDVGVYDDTHGWLRIRAELGAGGAVNATVTSADAAHESLKTALPAMTHYLGTESVVVNSIELHKFGDTSGGQQGSHANAQQQHGNMAGQHSRGDEQQQSSAQASVMAAMDDAASRREAFETSAGEEVDAVGAVEASKPVAGTESVNNLDAATDVRPAEDAGFEVAMDGLPVEQMLPWQIGYGGSGGWVNVSA